MLSDLSDTLVTWIIGVINLFPESPFIELDTIGNGSVSDILGYVNWFIPVGTCLRIFNTWLVCVAAYYIYQIVLRWVKVIE